MTLIYPIAAHETGQVIPLAVPDVSQRVRYLYRYYKAAAPTILRRHRLRLDGEMPCYQACYRLTERQKQHWFDLFSVNDKSRQTPFTYMTRASTLVLMRILADVGVNCRHLLHLKNQTRFHDAAGLSQADETLYLFARLSDILPVSGDRVALLIEMDVMDGDGRLLATYSDTFIIFNVPTEDVSSLKNHPYLGQREAKNILERPQPTLPAPRSRRVSLVLPGGLGSVYSRLSGACHLLQIWRWAASLSGQPASTVQGLYLVNQVLKQITEANGRPPRQLSIHFCRPAFSGQSIELIYCNTEFTFCDEEGRTLAAGKCEV